MELLVLLYAIGGLACLSVTAKHHHKYGWSFRDFLILLGLTIVWPLTVGVWIARDYHPDARRVYHDHA